MWERVLPATLFQPINLVRLGMISSKVVATTMSPA